MDIDVLAAVSADKVALLVKFDGFQRLPAVVASRRLCFSGLPAPKATPPPFVAGAAVVALNPSPVDAVNAAVVLGRRAVAAGLVVTAGVRPSV